MQEPLDSRVVKAIRQLRLAHALDCDTTRTNTPSDVLKDIEEVVATDLREVIDEFEVSADDLVKLLRPKLNDDWNKGNLLHIAREVLTQRKIERASASLSARIEERIARLQASLLDP